MKKSFLFVAAFSLLTSLQSLAQDHDVAAACRKDCPKATSNEEAHKCAEKKGRLNKEFRKSQCWEVNEKYEAVQAKAKGSSEQTEKDAH